MPTMTKEKPLVQINSKKMLPQFTEVQLEKLAGRVGLTALKLKLIHRAAHQTHQAIGYDLGGPLGRAEVVEVVLDADYMLQYGRDLTPDLVDWLKNKTATYPLEHVYEAVAAGFAFPIYE